MAFMTVFVLSLEIESFLFLFGEINLEFAGILSTGIGPWDWG